MTTADPKRTCAQCGAPRARGRNATGLCMTCYRAKVANPNRTCTGCGKQLRNANATGRCRDCWVASGAVTPGDVVLAEVEHMLSCGSSPAAIVRSLDMTPAAVTKALRRRGRHDLANLFDAIVRAEKSAA